MKIVIVEDMMLAAQHLRKIILSLRPDYEVVGEADSVDSATAMILREEPDLVFLDVRLSDGNSFEIFERLQSDVAVIFTTAYDEYALKAFQLNSIDYLLKPIEQKALAMALEKFERLHAQGLAITSLDKLSKLFAADKQAHKQRFIATSGTRIHSISANEVAWLRADDNVVYLMTFGKKEHIISETLTKLESQLDPARFFRINRQFIINYDAIDRMSHHTKGRIMLALKPSPTEDVIVSISRAGRFRRWLDR